MASMQPQFVVLVSYLSSRVDVIRVQVIRFRQLNSRTAEAHPAARLSPASA